jgi:predicted nucleic acid-binding protein
MYTIDTSVWVNGFDHREPGHVTSRQLLELLRVQGLPIIEPMLVLAEVAGAISQALELAAQHGLRGADAVYAAVARHAACILISLDNEHLTRLPDIVRVLTPEAALAELSPPPEEAPASCPSC